MNTGYSPSASPDGMVSKEEIEMKRACAGLGLAVLLLGGWAAGQSILVLSDQCNRSVAHFPAALTALGLEFTETSDSYDFFLALTEGEPWDLVIVDEYSSRLDEDTLVAIADYIAGGGRVFMNYWEWDEDIAAAFEAELGESYFDPIAIYPWDEGHPLFSTLNVLGTLDPAANTCDSDGAYFQPAGDGVAVGGYTPESAQLQAAIIVGNEGRTVLFGGILGLFSGDDNDDGRADGLEFAENVVAFLLAAPIVRPRPVLWASISPADVERLLSELELAFEQTDTADGDPAWTLELAGLSVDLLVDGPIGDGYASLRLYATWPTPALGAIPLINAWNLTSRGSRAYVTSDGRIALDADLFLVGGVNWRAVWAFIERFEQAVTAFKAHLGQ